MEGHVFVTRIKVRSYELDSFGHVNHANFLNYLEAARGNFLEAYGLTFKAFDEWKSWPVIASVKIDYVYPAFFGDILSIKVHLKNMGRSSIDFYYEVFNQDDKLVVRSETTLVYVNEKGRPMAIPQAYKDLFSKTPKNDPCID